ncbi:MAG: MFS transporter [Paracoccus sp. (in: a-proteobacteria)]|uniref:MFS transporter n=1 Tax=Paracoccus sp. TaxID=267 RepID=UPI0026E06129|nr:MFS transporter [Paracoccus sp. (in: a-proteobacteria)]MDO5632129.1 MFS transporter [Paracoccus sp. (in: a-proteobacteria)]
MSPGILSLILAYMLSQFYRAFLAVLTPVLQAELGAAPGDLALSSGMWFIAFALMQPAVGRGLDQYGPRATVAVLLAAGGATGAAVFALASQPWHLHVAMALLGVGCAPALMGAYFIIAREFPPAAFGVLTGAVVGIGSLGNILGAAPLVWVTEALGWRETLWGLAALTLIAAAAIWCLLRDPARPETDQPPGSLLAVLQLRGLWFMLPLLLVGYAASAAIRGLWAGPYLTEVYDADATLIGRATLAMGLAMVVGNFLIGPMVRLVGSLRRTVVLLNGLSAAILFALWIAPAAGIWPSTLLLTLIGFSGAGYVLLMAHGRPFLPPHLLGRGVTFLNMFSISGVALMQFASRPLYNAMAGMDPAQVYGLLFLFFAVPLAIATALYLLTPEAP